MILQETQPRRFSALRRLLERAGPRRAAAVAGVVLLVLGSTLWGLYEGMYLYRVKVAASLADLLDDVLVTRLAIVPNWIGGWWSSDAEQLSFDIKHSDFQKLAYQRELALARGVLIGKNDDFVPARLHHGGRALKAKVRLKGDWADHVSGEKWSLRVKLSGDETLFGMNTFSLQHPQTRHFVYEWIFHQALAREDLLPLRYDFVEVSINGKDLGVYALEEHFDERLLEHGRRKPGPILKFDESLHWSDIVATGKRGNWSATGQRVFRSAPVDSFGLASQRKDPKEWQTWLEAASLLEAFRARQVTVAQAFDSKKLATYFALVDLLGAEHAASWINLRFYYDPIASRFEPVGFDGNAGRRLHNVLGAAETLAGEDWGFLALAFADPAFVADYVAALERVADPAYLDALLADVQPGLARNLRVLHKEFPWLRFEPTIFRANQRTIQTVLTPGKGLHAYLAKSGPSGIELELANLAPFPIQVVGARSGSVSLAPQTTAPLPAIPPTESAAWVSVPFERRGGAAWSDALADALEVEYRVVGSDAVRREKVYPWPRRTGVPVQDLVRRAPNVRDFDFVAVDDAARVISLRPGSHRLDRDLIVPEGYRLHAGPGTSIDLVQSAAIVSRSPLDLRGGPDAPVVIESSDGTGQGLVVIDAGERSTLENVSFHGLRSPSREGWQLTGAVTFYRSPVALAHVEFRANVAEDSLNLVRSPFEIDECAFSDASSDALDVDYSDGSIRRSHFLGTGKDAIEVSGANVSVASVRIERAGDKGISAGEHASLQLRDVEILDSSIGVASRDLSHIVADDLLVRGAKVGVTLYQRKSEFGPAEMELRDARLEEASTPYLLEEGSKLVMAGREVEANANGVYAQLYGAHGG